MIYSIYLSPGSAIGQNQEQGEKMTMFQVGKRIMLFSYLNFSHKCQPDSCTGSHQKHLIHPVQIQHQTL